MRHRNLGGQRIRAARGCHTRKGVEPLGDLRYAAGLLTGGFFVVNDSYLWYLDSRRLRLENCGQLGLTLAVARADDVCRLSNKNDASAGAKSSCELSTCPASRRTLSDTCRCRFGPRGHGILPPRFLRQQPDA